jgi:hypothetical protein
MRTSPAIRLLLCLTLGASSAMMFTACATDDEEEEEPGGGTTEGDWQIRVTHMSVATGAVDIYATPDQAGTGTALSGVNLAFGRATQFLSYGTNQTVTFDVRPAGAAADSDPALNIQAVNFDADERYTVVAIGNADDKPLATLVLNDAPPAAQDNTAFVRAVHAATAVGQVDIYALTAADPTNPIQLFRDVDYGVFSEFTPVPAGTYDVFIDVDNNPGVGSREVYAPGVVLPAGAVITVYATMGPDGPQLYAQTADGISQIPTE